MNLLNFNVDRIIIHQVFQRDLDGSKVPPTQSHEYTRFDRSALEAFRTRVKDAIGDGSKAVQMEIVDQGDYDLPTLVDKMVSQDDEEFAVSSYDAAKILNDVQNSKSIPGGIVVVFSGTHGSSSKKFWGVMKADIYSGYKKEVNPQTNEISLEFIKELLLTPASRLYKTAVFIEKANYDTDYSNLNDKWFVLVSDSQINKADGKAAAKYFYSGFLGCGYPETSARTTKKFYEHAHKFIEDLDMPETSKVNLYNALTTYLKVDQASTVSSSEFAERYIHSIDIQDDFTCYMREQGLPGNAFTKDLEHIQTKLKFRKIKFRRNIQIQAPADKFEEFIIMEPINGNVDENGVHEKWTKVTIKDSIVGQE